MRNQRGFIVIAVLWMLAALSALVVVYLGFVTSSAAVVAVGAEQAKSEALIAGAVELTAFRLAASPPAEPPSSGSFNARIGDGRVEVAFTSEAARINLNGASRPLLAGLFTSVGAPPADAAFYADRIIAWRSPAQNTQNGAQNDPEDSAYRVAGLTYLPRHAPFPAADELWLVQGIPSQFVQRVLPLVTVFSDVIGVNVADAPLQVLAALPGMTSERLQQVAAIRGDPAADARIAMSLLGDSGAATLASAKAYRLTIVATAANNARTAAEIVILPLPRGDEPYRVLSWRSAFDGAAQQNLQMSGQRPAQGTASQ